MLNHTVKSEIAQLLSVIKYSHGRTLGVFRSGSSPLRSHPYKSLGYLAGARSSCSRVPKCPSRKIDRDAALPRLQDRQYHISRSKHILRFYLPNPPIMRELIKQHPHHLCFPPMSFLYQASSIPTQLLLNPDELLADLVYLLSTTRSTGSRLAFRLRLAVSMKTHHRIKSTPLKPPCEQLPEC